MSNNPSVVLLRDMLVMKNRSKSFVLINHYYVKSEHPEGVGAPKKK